MIRVLDDAPGPITHLVHASGLHLRLGAGARHAEYAAVMDAWLDRLADVAAVRSGAAAVVWTGDLLHQKGRLDAPALTLLLPWMQRLSRMAPVFLVGGKHDIGPGPDVLQALCAPFEGRVFYLAKTGLYRFRNIGIGVAAIGDDAGIPDGSPLRAAGLVPIGIAYGASRCEPAWRETAGYSLALLGGQSRMDAGPGWAFPGSLIQQDYDEPLEPHGFLLWDLAPPAAAAPTPVHIPNPYGFITLHGDTVVGTGQPLAHLARSPGFPAHPRVRVLGDPGPARALLDGLGIRPSELTCTGDGAAPAHAAATATAPAAQDTRPSADTASWQEFLGGAYADWIEDPTEMLLPLADALPSNVVDRARARNAKLQKLVRTWKAAAAAPPQAPAATAGIRIVHVAWDNVLCYGDGNYLDFEPLRGKIALLHGANAMGKSSFLDALCIGLFGEPTPFRGRRSGSLVHDAVQGQQPMRVRLLLAAGEDPPYEVCRVIDGTRTLECRVRGPDGILADGPQAVDAWLAPLLGSREQVLASTILPQIDPDNFFYRPEAEQKAILDAVLRLDAMGAFGRIVKEAWAAHEELSGAVATAAATLDRIKLDGCGADDILAARDALAAAEADLAAAEEELHAWMDATGAMTLERAEALGVRDRDPKALAREATAAKRVLAGLPPVPPDAKEAALRLQGEQGAAYRALLAQKAALPPVPPDGTAPMDPCDIAILRSAAGDPIIGKSNMLSGQACIRDRLDGVRLADLWDEWGKRAPPAIALVQCRERTKAVAAARARADEGPEEDPDTTIGELELFLAGMRAKQEDAKVLRHEIAVRERLQGELAGAIDGSVFNPECWACQQQPARARHAALGREIQKRRQKLARIEAYLEKLEPVSVYEEQLADARQAQEDRALLASADTLAAECRAWDVAIGLRRRLDHDWPAAEAQEVRAMHEELDGRIEALRAGQREALEAWAQIQDTEAARARAEEAASVHAWGRVLDGRARVARLRANAQQMHTALATIEKRREEEEGRRRMVASFHEAAATIAARAEGLQDLYQRLFGENGYRNWIYRTRVIPRIEDEVNGFLRMLDPSTPLRLEIAYDGGAFAYHLADRGNRPCLELASGYQRFLLGLGMRVVLARMGAMGPHLRHLFIDEGFVAFDPQHMEHVPDLLHKILAYGGYDSMVLMSHLELVQDAADVRIELRRAIDGRSSELRYGKPYPREDPPARHTGRRRAVAAA